jgi:hypothetical protein
MHCPIDKVDLVMAERQGIEIDYCPKCRGVWLDRGELDKIIERVSAESPPRQPAAPLPPAPQAHSAPPAYGHAPQYGHPGKPYDKKRKSMLSELFDFD